MMSLSSELGSDRAAFYYRAGPHGPGNTGRPVARPLPGPYRAHIFSFYNEVFIYYGIELAVDNLSRQKPDYLKKCIFQKVVSNKKCLNH